MDIWFLVSRLLLGRIRRCGLVGGGVSMGVRSEVKKKHIPHKWAEKEIREMSPFTIVTNNIKYLVSALTM